MKRELLFVGDFSLTIAPHPDVSLQPFIVTAKHSCLRVHFALF